MKSRSPLIPSVLRILLFVVGIALAVYGGSKHTRSPHAEAAAIGAVCCVAVSIASLIPKRIWSGDGVDYSNSSWAAPAAIGTVLFLGGLASQATHFIDSMFDTSLIFGVLCWIFAIAMIIGSWIQPPDK